MAVTGYLTRVATGRTITESGGLPWIEGDLGISGGGGSLGTPAVLIDSDSGRTYGTGSYTTGSSSTPTAGSKLIVLASYCTNGGGDPGVNITISDSGGHTWSEPVSQHRRVGSGTDHIGEAFFVADNSSTSTFTVTVDTSAGDIYAWEVLCIEVPGGSGATIGATGNVSNTGNGAVSITLSASPDSASYVIAGLTTYETNDITLQISEGAGWTEAVEAGRSVPNSQIQYRTGSTSTSVDWADNGTSVSGYLGLAFELVGSGSATPSDSDTGSGSDSQSLSAALSGAETATGTDAGTVAAATSQTDTGTGTDAGTVAVAVPGSDTATGTEAASTTATLSGSETSSGTDASSIAVALSDAETGTGTDAGSITVPTSGGSDPGSGTEGFTLVVTISATDTGSGADANSIAAAIGATETGSGSESSSLEAVGGEETIDGGLDISYSDDQVTDRGIGMQEDATGVEGDPEIVYVVRAVSDGDTAQGYDMANPNYRPGGGTLLSEGTRDLGRSSLSGVE